MPLTRGASPALLSVLAGHFHPVLLAYADWPDGAVRAHTGVGTLAWGGQDWTGAGRLVDWSLPGEEMGAAAGDGSVRVAGPLDAILSEMGTPIRNRLVQVWLGAVTRPAGNVLVTGVEPVLIFTGTFQGRGFSLSEEDRGDLTHDLDLALGMGPPVRARASLTHSYEDQIAAYPGDTAGRHVQHMTKKSYNPPVWPEP